MPQHPIFLHDPTASHRQTLYQTLLRGVFELRWRHPHLGSWWPQIIDRTRTPEVRKSYEPDRPTRIERPERT